jgi:toxin FitB
MIILDTDIVSNLRKKKPHPRLLIWIEETGWDELATTALSVMEIRIGIERARRNDPAVAAEVQLWLDGLLAAGTPQVLPLDTEAAILLAKMRETPSLKDFLVQHPSAKETKTGADLAIASIAIAHSAVIATNNDKDFLAIDRHFPLPGLYNPFDGRWLIEPEHPTPEFRR